jgi:hypothetical protein
MDSIEEQADVFGRCTEIFRERNDRYHDTWKQYGALANLARSAQKVDRLMAVWWHETDTTLAPLDPAMLDDAYDAINHLAFFIRCARIGNLTGEAPKRPEPGEEKLRLVSDNELPGMWERADTEGGSTDIIMHKESKTYIRPDADEYLKNKGRPDGFG